MRKRILIYKRTHTGDPDERGCFGRSDCMGQVRDRNFEAVIGVGGVGAEPQDYGIAGKVTWIGDGAHRDVGLNDRGKVVTLVTFDRFRLDDADGVGLRSVAPLLAKRLLDVNTRHVMNALSDDEHAEAMKLLELAAGASPSKWKTTKTGHGDAACRSAPARRSDRGCRPTC